MSNEYYPNILLNVHFSVKTIAKLLDAVADRRTAVDGFKMHYTDIDGVRRAVTYGVDATKMDAEMGIFYLTVSWKDSETGKRLTQRIEVEQQESHRDRIKTYDDDAPYRAYGKQYYRGKLTPYGKRVQRWQEKEDRSFTQLLRDCGSILGIDIEKLNL